MTDVKGGVDGYYTPFYIQLNKALRHFNPDVYKCNMYCANPFIQLEPPFILFSLH